MFNPRQRHQHGVTKSLVEFSGGVLVGAAGVLLLRAMLRRATRTPSTPTTTLPVGITT